MICVDGCRFIPVAEAARDIVLEARKLVEVRVNRPGTPLQAPLCLYRCGVECWCRGYCSWFSVLDVVGFFSKSRLTRCCLSHFLLRCCCYGRKLTITVDALLSPNHHHHTISLPFHRWLTAACVHSQSDLGMTGIAWGVGDPVSDGEGSLGEETGTAAADLSGGPGHTGPDGRRLVPVWSKLWRLGGSRTVGFWFAGPAAAVAAETERRDSRPPPAENRSERTKRPSSSNARTEQHTPATQKPSPSSADRSNPAPPARPARPARSTRQTPAPQPSRSPPTDQSSSTAQRYQTTSAERRRRRRRISHALFGRRRGQQAAGTAEGSPCLEAESPEEGPRSPALRRRRGAVAADTAGVTVAAATAVAAPPTSVATTTGATSTAGARTAVANSGVTESTPRPANILRLTPGVTPASARPPTQFITPAPPPALVITPVPTPDSAGRSRLSSGLNLSSQSNTDLFDSFEIGSRSALALGSTGKKVTPRQSSAARSDRSGAVSADKTGKLHLPGLTQKRSTLGLTKRKAPRRYRFRMTRLLPRIRMMAVSSRPEIALVRI